MHTQLAPDAPLGIENGTVGDCVCRTNKYITRLAHIS